MPISRIGPYTFFRLSPGPPAGVSEQVDIESQGGVDGWSAWPMGQRGMPQRMTSLRDVADLSDAVATRRNYESLKGEGAQQIVWAGITIDDFRVLVLDVRGFQSQALLAPVGGLQAGSILLTAEWILLPVEV